MRGLVLPVLLLVAAPLAAQQTIQYQCDSTGKCIPVSTPTTKPAPTVTVTVPASPSSPPSVTVTPPKQAATTSRFTLSGQFSSLSVSGVRLVAADAVAEVGITPTLSLRDDNVLISLPGTGTSASAGPIGQLYLAGPMYDISPLNNWLNKTQTLGPGGFHVSIYGEVGISRSSANQTYAESGGLSLTWCPQSNPVCVNIFDGAWVHGSVPIGADNSGNPLYGNNGARISVGVSF